MDQVAFPFAEGILSPASRARRRAVRALVKAVRAAIAEQLELDWSRRPAPPPPSSSAGGNEGPLLYIDMPKTRGDCRGPGICPVFRCKHNLALRVKDKGAIKVDGGGVGTTLRPAEPASRRKIDRIVDAIIAKADEIGSLCALDLAEEDFWHDEPRYGKQRTIPEVAKILGLSEEMVRQDFLDATHELEIAEARDRRAEQRAQAAARPSQPPSQHSKLVQIRRKK